MAAGIFPDVAGKTALILNLYKLSLAFLKYSRVDGITTLTYNMGI